MHNPGDNKIHDPSIIDVASFNDPRVCGIRNMSGRTSCYVVDGGKVYKAFLDKDPFECVRRIKPYFLL